jgi:TonB-linked SusC/RagA family outer membrane protein
MENSLMKRDRLIPSVIGLALVCTTAGVLSAQAGTIRGTVTDSAARRPVQGVQIQVVGSNRGAMTDSAGEYQLRDVPTGTLTLRVQRIGYGSVTRSVTVSANQTTTQDFVLGLLAHQLGEVVVTGYGTAQRREISNSVSSVTGEAIVNTPQAGLDGALQGKAAGVQVIQNAGNPGNGITVRVRGASSLSASNQPLYVIDGVPLIREDFSQLDVGGQDITAVTGVSPDEIANIDILKDAAAASIYGSRASNGVVMITTKRGQAGRPKITFNTYTGWQQAEKHVDMMTAAEYVEFMFEAVANDRPAGYTDAEIADELGFDRSFANVKTDWQREIFRTAPIRDIALQMLGGSERVQYFLSGAHFDQEGTVIGSAYNRQNVRANIDFRGAEKLSVRSGLAFIREDNDRNENDNTLDGVVTNAIATPAIYPVRQPGGFYTSTDDGLLYTNPVAIGDLDAAESRTFRALGNVEAEYLFTDRFRLTGRLGGDILNLRDLRWFSPQIIGRFANSVDGVAQQGNNTATRYTAETFGTYEQMFGTNRLSVVGGGSVEWNESELSFLQGEGFANEGFRYPGNAGKVTVYDGDKTGNNLVSAFSRANVTLRDRYFLTASLRTDGSSRFGENNRFGVFPAASVGWMISEEGFAGRVRRLGDLKLRASYGVSGNQGIGDDFAPLGRFGKANYSDEPGIAPSNIENPDLKWETTKEFDVGLDFTMFGGRIGLIADHYRKTTNDLLVLRPIARITGFSSFWSNIGTIENVGYELGINTINLDAGPSGLRWTSDFNISWNRNEVVELFDDQPFNSGIRSMNRVEEGQPLGAFHSLKFTGVDPQTGDAQFLDLNGDGSISSADRTIIGSPHPDFWGGFTNTFGWRGFEVRGFFQFSQGAEVYNAMRIFSGDGGFNLDNKFADELRRWQQPGDITDVPRASWDGESDAHLTSSRFLEDGSYVRFQELTLSYRVPERYSRFSRLNNAQIFVSGRNLKTWTDYSGYNPDVNSLGSGTNISLGTDFYAYPLARSWMIGISGGF